MKSILNPIYRLTALACLFAIPACDKSDSGSAKKTTAPTTASSDEDAEVAAAKKAMEEMAKKGSSPNPARGSDGKKSPSPAPKPAKAGPDNGGNWAQWGRDGSNNMMSTAKGLPTDFTAGEENDDGQIKGAKLARWVVKMGSQAYGTPTVQDGRVFIGTNNDEPRLESIKGDHGIVMCFDEKSGELLWQFSAPKLKAGKASDWPLIGICSSILLDDKYGYVITNRGEVICLDLKGMSDGNDGFKDEGKYLKAGLDGLDDVSEPAAIGDKDADIVWGYDMRSELGVVPHNITSSSVTIAGDYIFASTSNGVDWSHINIPQPFAPCLVALDKKTGKLAAEEDSGISGRTFHCNWSSPGFSADLAGKPTVVFGGGDGFTYGFHASEFEEKEDGGEKFHILKELWKVDCCPAEYRRNEKGEKLKYATYPGPSEIIASPVTCNNKVYVATGQDPEHGEGVGCLTCIDPAKGTGQDAVVWQFKEIGRSLSTPSVVDGLVYIADYSGRVYCLDAESGGKYWEHDTLSHIWGSTMVVDGKIYLGNEDGELLILKAGKEKEELEIIDFPSPIYSTPVIANGTIYVMTQTHLYAYGQK